MLPQRAQQAVRSLGVGQEATCRRKGDHQPGRIVAVVAVRQMPEAAGVAATAVLRHFMVVA